MHRADCHVKTRTMFSVKCVVYATLLLEFGVLWARGAGRLHDLIKRVSRGFAQRPTHAPSAWLKQ